MNAILVIKFTRTRICWYAESVASIHFCSWWFCEIRLSNGLHSHHPGLGTGRLRSGLLFSGYVHRSEDENVDAEYAIWHKRCHFSL